MKNCFVFYFGLWFFEVKEVGIFKMEFEGGDGKRKVEN